MKFKMNLTKRLLSIVLCLAMVLTMLPLTPMTAYALEADNLCEHHTEHTAECHYVEAVEGSPCTHEHSEACYAAAEECQHIHGDCGYVEAVEGHACHYECELCALDSSSGEDTEGEESLNEEAESQTVCTCESDDPEYHAPFCDVYVLPENPECFCAEKCTEENVNEWCDVCYAVGIEGCNGEEQAAIYSGTAYTGAVTPTKITSNNYASFGLTDNSYNGYYAIRTAAELYGFANLVNGGSNSINGVLLQDILVNTGTVTESGSSSGTTYNWTPIGNSSNPYLGTFDGNGCTISGIYINDSDSEVGLFGRLGKLYKTGGNVKNMILTNSYLCGSSRVGGVVGRFDGDYAVVSKCKVNSTVSIYATHESEPCVGGITGDHLNDALGVDSVCKVSDCVSFATVKAVNADDFVGAVVGIWRQKDNASEFVQCSNCYYLEGSATDKNGKVQGGTGGYGDIYNWCTVLTSANDSHTHVSVEHKEIKATCLSEGRSAYEKCLICGSVTEGTDTTYSKDVNNHVTESVRYGNIDTTYHMIYHACCGAESGKEEHDFIGTATCTVGETCPECNGVSELNKDNHSGTLKYTPLDKTNHKVTYSCCEAFVKNEEHTFSGGNCVTNEICEFCEENGATCPDVHASTETVIKVMLEDATKHATYHKCCDTLIDGSEAGHTYDDGECSICEYICRHENMVSGICSACGEGSVKYLHREWDGIKVVTTEKDTPGMPTVVTSSTTTMSNGWYIVYDDVTIDNRITMSGEVNLILASGCCLTANKGITVNSGNTLIIYGDMDGTGKLVANASDAYAGIGSTSGTSGTVIIHGGVVNANGGTRYSDRSSGAGIGGAVDCSNGAVTIYGGIVSAVGGNASYGGAGIGGGGRKNTGSNGGSGGTVKIYGGTVYAHGRGQDRGGAGIGGGAYGYGGTVVIEGGNVQAAVSKSNAQLIGHGDQRSGGTLKDSSGNDVSLVTLTLSGIAEQTVVTELQGLSDYGLTDVYTLDGNKLFIYLPADTEDPISITAGGSKYDCKNGRTYSQHEYLGDHCTEDNVCTNCGNKIADALGHYMVDGNCTRCGFNEQDGIYYISTVEQLISFEKYVNAGNKEANAKLMADIDLSGYEWNTICETGLYYNAYGEDLGYAGTFDGNGHVIKNITVKSSTTMDASCGLFGTVSGTIKHLGIEGFTFVDGGKDIRTGAIVGQLIKTGRVENCYVKNATITPGEHVTGGIAGCVYDGTIENCYVVESIINGSSGRYGYIVGDSRGDGGENDRKGTVKNCYTDNETIRSNNTGNITNCATKSSDEFASGEVTYLLNGSKSDGDLVWYQTLTEQTYPKFSGSVVYYDETNGYNNHVHNWTYEKVGDDTIKATCEADGCTNSNGGSVAISQPDDTTYTGSEINAELTYSDDWQLGELTIIYNATERVNVTGKDIEATITLGSETASITYQIAKASISEAAVSADDQVYTGSVLTPDVSVTLNEKTLTKDTDYTVSYEKNTNAGTATVTVTGTGNYSGTATGSFTITDETDPTGEIQIKENSWKEFLNQISFGLFFKDTVDVTITADGTGSDVAKVEYLLSDTALAADSLPTEGWTELTERNGVYSFGITSQNKGSVYVRITDAAGNDTVINSEGVVVYADSTAKESTVYHTFKSTEDLVIELDLNGNTVKDLKFNGHELTNHWSVDGNKVTIDGDYLDGLNVLDEGSSYPITIYFNPMGEETDKVALETTVNLVITQAEGSVTNITDISKTYDGTAVSAPAYTSLSGGTAAYEYKEKDAEDSTYTTTAPDTVGDYVVRVTVAEDRWYKEASATAEFSISEADLTDVSVAQDGALTYTGDAQAAEVTTKAAALGEQTVTFTYSTEENSTYGTMPEFTNAGDYTVYYKASASNHNDAYGSFTVTIDKAVVTEPTIVSKAYTGEAQTADISGKDLYTVEANGGGTAKGEYDVVLKLADAENYKWKSTEDAAVTLKFVITEAENSWTTEPSITGWTYGETANAPVGAAAFGTVNVVYTGTANDGTQWNSEDAPSKAGEYKATFTVTETADYTGIEKAVDFTIAKATYDMSDVEWDYTNAFTYDGREKAVSVIGLPEGVTVSGYTGEKATEAGTYTAKATLVYDGDNYNAPTVDDLTWKIENDWTPVEYTVSSPNGNGWMNEDFVITAADGYQISLTNIADGAWSDTLTGAVEGAENSITFYLKNEATGAISLAATERYKLDKNTESTGTTGKVFFDERNGWETFLNTITFNLFYKDEVTVKVEATDALSGVDSIKYMESSTAMSLDALKNARSVWAEMPEDGVAVTLEDAKQFIYYVRITDKAGNVTYLSTDGAEYDTTAPAISGIVNRDTYYTTQKVVVSDKNLDTVTLNGETASANITLEGNKEATYTIVATDKAGNETTFTVTMKPVEAADESIDDITKDNVDSSDKDAIQDVIDKIDELLEDEDLTEEEKTALEGVKDKAEELLDKIEEVAGEIADITDKVDDYKKENVTSDDKAAIEDLVDRMDDLLESENLTDAEKEALEAVKDTAEDLLDKIEEVADEIADITDKVDDYDKETVTSDDKAAIEDLVNRMDDLLEGENLTDAEKEALEAVKDTAEELLDQLADADKADETENIEKVKDITSENVTPDDKSDLEDAKSDLEKALEDYSSNYTEEEKKAIEDEIKRIDDALDVIERVENVEDLIDKIPDDINKDSEDEIKAAEDAYNALTDYEKSLVDKDAKKALEDAKEDLAALKKAEEESDKTTSPDTGDYANILGNIIVMMTSAMAIAFITISKKRKVRR